MIVTGRMLKTAANAAIAMILALVTSSDVCFAQASTKAQTSSPTASTQNVNVVNTPTVNVATLPAVTVTGTPAVSAAQSGSWKVGITGIPGVQVTNTIAQAVPTLTAGPSLVTHMGQLPAAMSTSTAFRERRVANGFESLETAKLAFSQSQPEMFW